MSFNLIDSAKSLFTNELVSKASSFFGESETSVSKAIDGILPTIVNGLMYKASTSEGAAIVTRMVNEQHNSNISGNLESFFGSGSSILLNKSSGLLIGLFGHKLDGITRLISNFAGTRAYSSASLLGMAVSAVLSLIAKHSNTAGTNNITALLSSQQENIEAALPAGLNLSSVLNNAGGNVSDISTTIRSKKEHGAAEENERSGLGILLMILLLVSAAMFTWYLFEKGGNKVTAVVMNKTDSIKTKPERVVAGKLDNVTGDWIYDAGEMVSIALPNNAGELIAGKNSTEYKLVHFLNDITAPVDTVKGTWFEFTNVHFKKGGAELTTESMGQLENMVTIAIAYPNARFKFGGYTDNTGSDDINIPLSQKRADTVAAMVLKLGAPKESIIDTEGYGSQWPIQPNDTKEGQAQNRRVAVRVKAK